MKRGLEISLRLGRKRTPGLVRTLQDLPEIAVARAIVQLAFKADGGPVGASRGGDDVGGVFNLALARREGLQDGTNLVRVDAPHPGVAQFESGMACGGGHGFSVIEFRDNTVR